MDWTGMLLDLETWQSEVQSKLLKILTDAHAGRPVSIREMTLLSNAHCMIASTINIAKRAIANARYEITEESHGNTPA
jgi:hypothetical protein